MSRNVVPRTVITESVIYGCSHVFYIRSQIRTCRSASSSGFVIWRFRVQNLAWRAAILLEVYSDFSRYVKVIPGRVP